ncbi:hypothetical protein OC834_006458 [Tilletia horrida]|nr:hypothetical protein OC834_006458 [Tilletia horrida]
MPLVLSGIDTHPAGGGTWLGISRSGRFGSLLNYTERPPPPPKLELGIDHYLSRGELVRRWLVAHDASEGPAHISGQQGLEAYLQSVHETRDYFPGFNLLIGQTEQRQDEDGDGRRSTTSFKLGYVSNRTQGDASKPLVLEANSDQLRSGASPCVACGLSNSVYQEPWPKVQEGKRLFDQALQAWPASSSPTDAEEADLIERLFAVLGTNSDPEIPPPQPANIRSTIQVPPVQLPIAKPNQRTAPSSTRSDAQASRGDANPPPVPAQKQDPPQQGTNDAARAIAAAIAAGAELGWYGTRLSTVILIRRSDGHATFVERDVFGLGEDGETVQRAADKGKKDERRFRWVIGGDASPSIHS